jgi:hypothetical protein
MDWLIIFLKQLLGLWTAHDDRSRPGWARQYAPAYVRKVSRTVARPGNEWSPPATLRLRCAPRAHEGPPDS